jgi:hypothetical protein
MHILAVLREAAAVVCADSASPHDRDDWIGLRHFRD